MYPTDHTIVFMTDRIKYILDYLSVSPSQFADMIDVGRGVISHILNGRNKPSLEVATKILEKFEYINSDWLILGIGEMIKEDYIQTMKNQQDSHLPSNDLFSELPQENITFQHHVVSPDNQHTGSSTKNLESSTSSSIQEINPAQLIPQKQIKEIIVYYSDNTFEVFQPQKDNIGSKKDNS